MANNALHAGLLYPGDCDCCDPPTLEPFLRTKAFSCASRVDITDPDGPVADPICPPAFRGGQNTLLITIRDKNTGTILDAWDQAVTGAQNCLTGTQNGTEGPNSPSTVTETGSGDTWSNITNVTAQDDTYATVTHSSGTSKALEITNFGFSIPAGESILGVLVEIDRKGTSGPVDNTIELIGVTGTSDNKADTGTGWPTTDTDTYVSYGGSTDRWGTDVTRADVNATGFGVKVIVDNNPAGSADIDHVRVTVYYGDAGNDCTDIDAWGIGVSTFAPWNHNYSFTQAATNPCTVTGNLPQLSGGMNLIAEAVVGVWMGGSVKSTGIPQTHYLGGSANVGIVLKMAGIFVPMTSGQDLKTTHGVHKLRFVTAYVFNSAYTGWAGEHAISKGKDTDCGDRIGAQPHNQICNSANVPAVTEGIETYYGDAATVNACFQQVLDGTHAGIGISWTPALNLTETTRNDSGAAVDHTMSADGLWYYIFANKTSKCITSLNPTFPTLPGNYHTFGNGYDTTHHTQTDFKTFQFLDSVDALVQGVQGT